MKMKIEMKMKMKIVGREWTRGISTLLIFKFLNNKKM